MKLDELSPGTRFLYVGHTQMAIRAKEMDIDKETYLRFVSEIWESMLLSNIDDLKEMMEQAMHADLKKFMAEHE